jgi:hypothetical protein
VYSECDKEDGIYEETEVETHEKNCEQRETGEAEQRAMT